MRRIAIAGLALLALVACSSGGPPHRPLAKDLAHALERAGLCSDPHLNQHRKREVLCAPRAGGGRTGVATFRSQYSTLRSVTLERDTARFIGCDFHAAHGTLTVVVGPHFTVVGSDRPAAVARVLHARVADRALACRTAAATPTAG